MHKIILYIISVLTVFTSCTTTDVPDKVSLQPQVMNDSLLTTMPGDLLLIDDYLVWSDPFSDNKFLHVHRSSDGKYIGSMGQKGEGPQEFVSPLINRFSINRCIAAHDANGKTRGYLSIDSLIVGKEPFMSLADFDRNIRMAKLDEQLYLTETENGENDYFKVSSNGKKSTFGVYPIREVKHHMGTYKTYDKDRGLLAFGPFNFSYLALYKKEGDNFKLLWERMPEKENYSVVDGAIRFDRSVMGVRDICMTKDYIVTLERDREVDPLDERTVGRNASKCPRTVFVYDYDGKLLKIVNLGMPVMRIAADGRSNALYVIGVNPDFALAKYDL